MTSRMSVVLTVVGFAAASAVAQLPDPLGGEFRVNTYTTGGQYGPRVAHQPDGGFIVVWGSVGSSGDDTSGGSVQGQRYSSVGVPLGNEFQVNTSTTDFQGGADIGTDAAGNFVVVWVSPHLSGNGNEDIFGQRFLANGSAVGDEFLINSYMTGRQESPAVAVAPGGEFVVAWNSDTTSHAEHRSGVVARRFESDATPMGSEFQVNTYTTEKQRFPVVAMDAEGDFLVVWESDGSFGTDSGITESKSVQGQRFSAAGTLLGGEFQVNTYTTGNQYKPGVAMGTAGDFVVVWRSDELKGQRFGADGTPLGDEFAIRSYHPSGDNGNVAMTSAGAFVVVWDGNSSGSDTSISVQMRRFSADGMPVGEDFQVNTFTSGRQEFSAVSALPSGEIVVVWEGPYDDPSVTYRDGIYGQRFDEDLLFASGLEFGDLSGWSFTIP